MEDAEQNVVNLEAERIARLPMLDVNLSDLNELMTAFVNQFIYLGHRDVIAAIPVGDWRAELSVKVTKGGKPEQSR